MKKRIKEKVQRVFLIINLIAMNMAFGITTYAAGDNKSTNKLLNSRFVQGWINLTNDTVLVVLAVEALVIGLLEAIQGLMYQFGSEEDRPRVIKRAKGIAIVGAIIVCLTGADGLVALILSYFTSPTTT